LLSLQVWLQYLWF